MTWLGASSVGHLLGATCAASLGCLVAAASTLPTILSPDSILYQPGKLLTAEGALAAAREFWVIFGPGGKLHPAYFLEHKGHLVVEGVLLAIILYMFLQTSFKPKPRAEEALTDKEIDQLCKEWEPMPLVPKLGPDDALPPPPVISERQGAYVLADGKRVLNLAACDFFNMTDTAPLKDVSAKTIAQYGVGSCGPRSFYGTIDVHLTLEDELAKFMGTAECIIYSYDLATVASVIPCFASRKDTLVMDEYCNYAIVSGAQLSRARVLTFKHNDLVDLERVLQRVEQEDKAAKKPLYRRMILVEGLYAGYGDLAPLKELVAIKEKYKYNLLVDESYSFGVLGKTGRGAVEHAGLKPEQVEIICATMGNALASAGGFCVGSKDVVEHQRLSSTGYVFSASLPPYLATAVSESLHNLTQNVEVLQARLAQASTLLRREIKKVPEFKLLNDSGLSALPLLLVGLAKPPADAKQHERLLTQVKEHMLAKGGVLVATTVSSFLEPSKPPASLRVHACALVGEREVAQLVAALRQAAAELGLQA